MVAMRGVIFWTQNHTKAFAGAFVHHPQKLAFGGRPAIPILFEDDPAAVFEFKSRDIDSGSA